MYIRRKAFSIAYDENGEEKLFSTTEIMSEEAYLEKLYSENEEQKEFASVRDAKKFVKQWAKATIAKDASRKKLNQIGSRLAKSGKGLSKFVQTKDIDKVAKGYLNAGEKIMNQKLTDQQRSEFIKRFKKDLVK